MPTFGKNIDQIRSEVEHTCLSFYALSNRIFQFGDSFEPFILVNKKVTGKINLSQSTIVVRKDSNKNYRASPVFV